MEVIMKRSPLSLLLVAGAYGTMLAGMPSKPNTDFTGAKLELIEQNLVIGLESNIPSF